MAALGRKAGPMRHRLEPRGGAKNEDLSEELEELCVMRQPTDSEGSDLGGPLLDRCERLPTHVSNRGAIPMCDWHAVYYRRYIGKVRPK